MIYFRPSHSGETPMSAIDISGSGAKGVPAVVYAGAARTADREIARHTAEARRGEGQCVGPPP